MTLRAAETLSNRPRFEPLEPLLVKSQLRFRPLSRYSITVNMALQAENACNKQPGFTERPFSASLRPATHFKPQSPTNNHQRPREGTQ